MMPTLLELAGVEAPEGMDGLSWLPLLEAPDEPLHSDLFLTGGSLKQAGRWRAPELAIRTATRKFIRRVRVWPEATHLSRDVNTLCKPPGFDLAGSGVEPDPRALVEYFNALPHEELYDLTEDPCETNNLIDARPQEAAPLRQALERYAATNPERC